MKKLLFVVMILPLFIVGCTKMQEKKGNETQAPVQNDIKNPHSQNPMDNPHSMTQDTKVDNTDMAPENAKDETADKFSKEAYDFEKTYAKDKSEANKKQLIEKHLAAGNYLMFKANLHPKKKYAPALRHYRRVLELDPSNDEAKTNKEQIEMIYESMGRPVPQD
ncbi:MAG: hypothetical protein ACP5P3_02790 [Ignavibacteria bacterium]